MDGTTTEADLDGAADERLLARLAGMWDERDGVPDDVVTRAVFAVQLERLDAELLLLADDVLELAGSRSSETVRTLRFTGDEVAIMVTITAGPTARRAAGAPVRIDGWVSPAQAGTVELRRDGGDPARQRVDRQGRFAFARVDPALAQLVYRPGDGRTGGGAGTVACPPIRL